MNKQIYELFGVTESDYKKWCELTCKPSYKKSSKEEFFSGVISGKIAKDQNGKLIKQRV